MTSSPDESLQNTVCRLPINRLSKELRIAVRARCASSQDLIRNVIKSHHCLLIGGEHVDHVIVEAVSLSAVWL